MLLLFAVLILTAISFECKAQEFVSKSITIVQDGKKIRYAQNDALLKFSEIRKITEVDEEAYRYMRKARGKNVAANILAVPGGFGLGWGFASLLFGPSNLDLVILGAGIVCIGICIPIAFSADKDIRTGVDVYNENLESKKSKVNLEFGTTSNGIGLVLNF